MFDAGAVYVFTRSGERLDAAGLRQGVEPADERRASATAVALSADGNTLAVSAFWESSNAKGINGNQKDESIPQAGAVYVFTRRGTTWSQQAYIKASNTGEAGTADAFGEGDQFGFSLALSGDGTTLAVGALTEDSAATGHQRQPGRQLGGSRPARSTSSRARARRGRSRPTSSRRTSMPATCSATPSR